MLKEVVRVLGLVQAGRSPIYALAEIKIASLQVSFDLDFETTGHWVSGMILSMLDLLMVFWRLFGDNRHQKVENWPETC